MWILDSIGEKRTTSSNLVQENYANISVGSHQWQVVRTKEIPMLHYSFQFVNMDVWIYSKDIKYLT
jgi:hypothetical protein